MSNTVIDPTRTEVDRLREQSTSNARTIGRLDMRLADLLDIVIRLHRERVDADTAVAAIDDVTIEAARRLLRERCDADSTIRHWLVDVDGLGHLLEEVPGR